MARPRKLPKVLTANEQKALLAQCNTRYKSPHRNLCMLRLMLEAGLRVGEVVALRPEHINMRTCKVMVREGKGAKDRVVWITDELRDLIGEWLERRPDSEWLFPTRTGKQVLTAYMRQMVKNYAEKAEIQEWEKVSPHTLRHTALTDLYRETNNLALVQKAAGHSRIDTTMIYVHIHDRDVEQAMRHRRTVET